MLNSNIFRRKYNCEEEQTKTFIPFFDIIRH
jgi:hypothetical protein